MQAPRPAAQGFQPLTIRPLSARPLTTLPLRALAQLMRHLALRRSRRRLDQLDARLLCDIGLTRAEASNEAARPIWDVPDHWRR